VKTIEAINAFQAVQKLINDEAPKTIQFSYALVKNKRTLETVVQQYNLAIADAFDPVLEELLKAWREIADPYAQRNNGQPVLDLNGNVVIAPERMIDYNLACEHIVTTRLDYRQAFDRRNSLVQSLQNAETDATIFPIALSLFPPETDFATVEMLYGLIDGSA
jgi:hypothetical protein